MSTGYSPAWSPGSARLQLGAASRLRSSSLKKPPEPLHRAVADCLSSSSSTSCSIFSSLLHGSTSAAVSEASRTLRDYLASPTTTDLAYCVILEHTLAERERSPAVVGRCVALLKRYLLRYKPTEETLLQIDRFCVNTIAECGISPNKRLSPWLDQQSGGLAISHAFASGALVKSLNYVRSLVAPHILKRSFQPAAFAGVLPASRQSLPTLSALLSRSFNTHLSPSNVAEASEKIDASSLSISNLSTCKKANGIDDVEYIALDVLKWRWPVEKQSSLLLTESDHVVSPQIMNAHSFLEVGAAALLLGEADARVKGQEQRHLGIADMPYLDQLLQPLSVTTATDSSSAHHHLRAITASKRTRPGTQQVWEDANVSTYRPRARPLFQYRHYSEQQPLRLNNAEVCEVMTAVCSGISSPNANMATVSSRLSTKCGKLSMDVAVSVLIKLVIDMYVLDSAIAAPLTLSMLQDMITSPGLLSKVRAFDLILNLGVHAHLLEPVISDDTSTIEEDFCQESYFDSEAELATQEMRLTDSSKRIGSSAIHKFESWILGILYEVLLLLVQIEENEESVWASALSCLLYFVCYVGKIQRSKLKGLDIRVVMRLLEICRMNSWAEIVRCTLICMLTNMFYQTPDASLNVVSTSPTFLHDRVDLIGGIEFIFLEYSLSKSREERGNLYLVLFDYVLHLINETCIATGAPEFVDYEIQSIASLLTLADAPEAFYISIKLGVEGIGNILKGSICSALSRYPNSERLNMLLEKIIEKFNTIINSFTHLDKEFFQLMQKTKVCKFLGCIETMSSGNSECIQVKSSWATLHSLLHSERIACRQNGYIWLGDLLIAEISEESNERIWDNIKKLQQNIAIAGSAHESSVAADVPLPISVMCGLLKSKHNFIRWGFLFVLERLLVRCKCLLDEIEEHSSSSEALGHLNENGQLKKANAVIDMMSSAMSLVAQINETDHINILKMCDILFSQLCLKVPPAIMMPLEDVHKGKVSSCMDDDRKVDADDRLPQQEKWLKKEIMKEIDRKHGHNYDTFIVHDTASMAALLLGGQAVVPMQLVSRVPAALFYWPLIQLAGAATDNIALGVAVGSKGRGNLPGATSDIRAALLLLLIGKCTADPTAFQEVGGEEFFRELLDDTDSRVAYYSSAFLLKRMMTDEPEKYQRMLQSLIFKAQQTNNEKLLENPYLQMRGILQMSNVLGTGL